MRELPRKPWLRAALGLVFMAIVLLLLFERGPSLHGIGAAFSSVKWQWVVVAIAFNLVSVVVRAAAWTTVIRGAIEPPYPSPLTVFSAFSVGLFANAVLPGRVGELARVAVLVRKLPRKKGLWATLVGTVLAHRVFDIVPVVLLVIYVTLTAKVPAWAISIVLSVIGVGLALFAFAFFSARVRHTAPLDNIGVGRRVLAMARQGLGVMRTPLGMLVAVSFQIAGWVCQLLAVYTAMRAFDIHAPLPAAGVVLLVMNVVTIVPIWPGNIGALQAVVAAPLRASYGVATVTGVAYGFGLQAIEASVGVGVGLIFLSREGLSFAMLRVMPSAAQAELDTGENGEDAERNVDDAAPERARLSG